MSKQTEIRVAQVEILALSPDNFSKIKFIELGAELKTLETCLCLAKVIFDEERT